MHKFQWYQVRFSPSISLWINGPHFWQESPEYPRPTLTHFVFSFLVFVEKIFRLWRIVSRRAANLVSHALGFCHLQWQPWIFRLVYFHELEGVLKHPAKLLRNGEKSLRQGNEAPGIDIQATMAISSSFRSFYKYIDREELTLSQFR